MNTIIIICEGQAEQEFCNSVLYPYFLELGTLIKAPVISVSNGGIVKWKILKREVNEYLTRNKSTTYVTTFIDFYGLEGKGYPQYRQSANVNERRRIVSEMEEGMKNEIDDRYRYRFVPYVQLHEFESLIFTDISILKEWFMPHEITNFKYLEDTIRSQPDTELINDSPQTAPSKRLLSAIPKYDKVSYGNTLLLEIGLECLRNCNTNFNAWITKLDNI